MRSTPWILATAFGALLMPGLVSAEDEVRTIGSVERLDPKIDELIPKDAKIEVLADGFEWTEGPVWVADGEFVLFSDIPNNRIVKWKEGEGTNVYMQPSGYTGTEKFTGREPGTNGLVISPEGHLTMCAHGDRMVVQMIDGQRKVLAEKYDGKRLNSPNDLVYHSNGELYFTDPPYGLPKGFDDPGRELDWCGVYRITKEGEVELLTKVLDRPNGIAFSPDEKTLYVPQSDPKKAILMAFPVKEDGTLGEGKVLLDTTKWVGERPGLPDGMKVDTKGNLWMTGPGGVYVLNPEGKILGRIDTQNKTANCAFGPDGTLYMTVDKLFCRIKTNAKGTKVDE